MSNVISFPKERMDLSSQAAGKSKPVSKDNRVVSATILLFTGVRYERDIETCESKPAAI